MCIPAHSPWPPGHTDAAQTVLFRLTVAGPFPDRPRVSRLAAAAAALDPGSNVTTAVKVREVSDQLQ